MEVDITKKVQYLMKYGLVGLILIAVLCAGGIYYYQHQHKYFNVYDAQVTSSLVAAKVHGNAMITEKVVAEGEHVEAGDVIAHVQSTVTDEQIANLEQTVALSQRNLDEIKKGQTVTVAVPSPAPAPAASAPRSSGSSQSVASAESRMNRMNELFEMGAISAVQRDAAVSAYHAAVAAASSSAPAASASSSAPAVRYQTTTQPPDPKAVQNAELQLKQAQAALDNAKQDAAETDIVAPVAGTVYYAQGIDEGSTVKAGETVASVGNADDIWVEAKVSPDKAAKIRLGQFVSYEIDGHQLQGSVQDIQQPAKKDDQSADSSANGAASNAGAAQTDPNNLNNPNAQNGQSAQGAQDGQQGAEASTADAAGGDAAASSQPKTTAEVNDADDADEDVMIIRISIPSGLNFTLKPGMKAVVKFAMNG
ncbi:HlyD family efflux transporter periplasmic adaptor subunit [Mitsuokella multacida]|uniref:HlyD family efflux transporter periplasmic adaptor subunit n=2 Tax=Mitsuokella multacida TaxID=52226 RepID=A0A414NWI5_9FIRM|nr:HlyD family efflux transporter periplasmic adaptor subunit [Mitsuokella multacida]RHF51515.1 HlyD family efflux transporter periplasmic adaptor subunit [Mitsuokella multacida]